MQESEYNKGIGFAIFAYCFWGVAPIYFKLLEDVSSTVILMHRIIWSFFFLIILMIFSGGFKKIKSIIKNRKLLQQLFITSTLIAVNWLIYIWAVNNGHMLDASLGYFINPLFNVLLGVIILSERLRKLQLFSVVLACIGVLIQLVFFGSIPLISILLAATFSLYGLLRKKINIDAKAGLLVETAMIVPFALAYLTFNAIYNHSNMLNNSLHLNLLLMITGIVTTIPLLCFSAAATRLPLSTLGFFQYIGPSIMFGVAIVIFNEPFVIEKSITFCFIWGALLLFVIDMIMYNKSLKKSSNKM